MANDDPLISYLTDVHAIEVQALEQMERAPDLAGAPELAAIFRAHREETAEHERLVREALEARGAKPSTIKDLAGRAGGWGMVLFAKLNPDTPGKLVFHAHSYEHMELAAYELLKRLARRLGDEDVAEIAERIGAQERAMADRLADRWDVAVEAALADKDADAIDEEVVKYLRDAYALEGQAIQLLKRTPYAEHLKETEGHQRRVEERLRELGSSPARFQAGALRLGAINLSAFFKAQPDTPLKLAGFSYAFEALEAGAYELLRRVADRAGDAATAQLATSILADEQRAAEVVAASWDDAVDRTLDEQGARA